MLTEEGILVEFFKLANSNPEKASIDIQKYINKLENDKEKDPDALSDAYLALSIANKKLENWAKGIDNAKISLTTAKKIKKEFDKNLKMSKARKEMGLINEIIQEYAKAIKEFDDGLNLLEKNLEQLTKTRSALYKLNKDERPLTEKDFYEKSTIVKNLYFDILNQKISVFLRLNDEKKAKSTISKPFIKFLEAKEEYYIEDLANFAELYMNLVKDLKQSIEFLNWAGELLLLDFFAKKISHDKGFWTKKIHDHIKEICDNILDMFKISPEGEILGKETLNILKQVEFETKDFSYVDKLLELKKNEQYKKGFEELNLLFKKSNEDAASPVVQLMIMNELMLALSQMHDYKSAIEKSKDAIKIIKGFKEKDLKNFMTAKLELILFRVNLKRRDYKQAEKEAKRAIDYFDQNLNTIGHAYFSRLELASSYMIQNSLDKAESILQNAIEMSEEIGSLEFLARLFELQGGIKLKSNDQYSAAINFQICALFYFLLNQNEKYQEFMTLAINLYGEYLKDLEFPGVEFN